MSNETRSRKGEQPSLSTMLRQSLDSNVIQVDFRKGKRKMAKNKKSAEVEDEEDLDDLLDDLDEVEEEDEDEEVEEDDDEDEDEDEEEDDDDEDPDEAPVSKRRSRKPKATSKKAPKEQSGVGTVEIAEAAGTTPRQLRGYLRTHGIQAKDDREGRYRWSSLSHPEVKKIIKAVKGGAIARENKAKLSKLKDKKAAAKTTKSTAKKSTAKKRRVKA